MLEVKNRTFFAAVQCPMKPESLESSGTFFYHSKLFANSSLKHAIEAQNPAQKGYSLGDRNMRGDEARKAVSRNTAGASTNSTWQGRPDALQVCREAGRRYPRTVNVDCYTTLPSLTG